MLTFDRARSDSNDSSTLELSPRQKTRDQMLRQPKFELTEGLEHCSFDNPYFKDDSSGKSRTRCMIGQTCAKDSFDKSYQHTTQHQLDSITTIFSQENETVCNGETESLDFHSPTSVNCQTYKSPRKPIDRGGIDGSLRSSIEERISNLHNRQVNSVLLTG